MRAVFTQLRKKVVLDPTAESAPRGHVLVGIGNPQDQGSHAGVILNQKGMKHGPNALRSLTEYVCRADETTVSFWRVRLPDGVHSIEKLIVEDLSLDTCFALYAFAERVFGGNNLNANPALDSWIDYISDWEQGFFTDQDVIHSPACLISLLGHSFLNKPKEEIGDGLLSCLTFVEALITQQCHPRSVQLSMSLPEYRLAMARYDLEQQRYLLALQHGTRCQLSIPLQRSEESVLVDALILEEIELSGILKIMARTDKLNTWTKNGFGLMAFYRPSEAGNGNDMTISVDPQKGLSLRRLWERLESDENRMWKGQRPTDHPRMIESYRNPSQPGQTLANAPNQPWWDDQGKYTLIAAPKVISPGNPGSKLEWQKDVLPALWDLYAPVPKDARPQPKASGQSGPGSQNDLRPLLLDAGKRLQFIRWEREANLSVAQSPTFKSWLAAQSMDLEIHSPMDLVQEDEFKMVTAPGGGVFLHREGLTIFDDWTGRSLPEAELQAIASDLAKSCGTLSRFIQKGLPAMGLHLLGQLREGKFNRRELEKWREELMEGKSDLLEVFALSIGSLGQSIKNSPSAGLEDSSPSTSNLQSMVGEKLRAELEVAWGITAQRAQVSELLDQLDHLNSQMADEIKEKRTRSFALWGSFLGVFIGVKELGETILGLIYPAREWSLLVWLGKGTKTLNELFQEDPTLEPVKHSYEKLHHLEYGLFAIAVGAALLAVYLAKRLGASVGPKE